MEENSTAFRRAFYGLELRHNDAAQIVTLPTAEDLDALGVALGRSRLEPEFTEQLDSLSCSDGSDLRFWPAGVGLAANLGLD